MGMLIVFSGSQSQPAGKGTCSTGNAGLKLRGSTWQNSRKRPAPMRGVSEGRGVNFSSFPPRTVPLCPSLVAITGGPSVVFCPPASWIWGKAGFLRAGRTNQHMLALRMQFSAVGTIAWQLWCPWESRLAHFPNQSPMSHLPSLGSLSSPRSSEAAPHLP